MENTEIIELFNRVLLRLEILINKQDDDGLLSMIRIARNREESSEKCIKEYERHNELYAHHLQITFAV